MASAVTGMLNPVPAIAQIAKRHGKIFLVDSMSAFGGIPLDLAELGIDFLVSSANKCIQGVPGFGFVIAHDFSHHHRGLLSFRKEKTC